MKNLDRDKIPSVDQLPVKKGARPESLLGGVCRELAGGGSAEPQLFVMTLLCVARSEAARERALIGSIRRRWHDSAPETLKVGISELRCREVSWFQEH